MFSWYLYTMLTYTIDIYDVDIRLGAGGISSCNYIRCISFAAAREERRRPVVICLTSIALKDEVPPARATQLLGRTLRYATAVCPVGARVVRAQIYAGLGRDLTEGPYAAALTQASRRRARSASTYLRRLRKIYTNRLF